MLRLIHPTGCRHDTPRAITRWWVPAMCGLLILTGCGGGGGDKPAPATVAVTTPASSPATTPAPGNKPTPTPPDSNPPPTGGSTTLNAAELAREFRNHGGKAVTVDGTVETVVDVSGGTNVVLATAQGFPKVRLRFAAGKWAGDKPAVGDTVCASGTVTKAVTATTFVDVSDCELVKRIPAKPDEGIAVTAVDVTAEYDKDAKAADAKYRGKTLKMTGEVLRADDAGGTAGAVVTGDGKADALKLKAGDKVTFTGTAGAFRVELTTNDWTLVLGQAKLLK